MNPIQTIGTPQCRNWSADIFRRHQLVAFYLRAQYVRDARRAGHVVANTRLRERNQRLIWAGFNCSVTADFDAIDNLANSAAKTAAELASHWLSTSDLETAIARVANYCHSRGFEFPAKFTSNDDVSRQHEKSLAAITRVSDVRWWRRQIRTQFNRRLESVLRDMQFVCAKKRNGYVSKLLLTRHVGNQIRNQKTLNSLDCVRNDGLTLSMSDCVAASVANPTNRRTELMVRMRGFEEIATGLEYSGLFVTLTTPSRFHAVTSRGHRNPKYNGSTPRDGSDWLNKTWALIRSKLARAGVKIFGFRVAEPHQDGTPHWHLLVFMPPDQVKLFQAIFKDYALLDSPEEAGAQRYRCDFKIIDPARGSATGYIAKYVAKNIDGYSNDWDVEAQCDGNEGAQRVRAWASLWGIRQFQQIGSVSVTVWRELRRTLEKSETNQQVIIDIRDAANRGDWAEFVRLMGGPNCPRANLALRPFELETPRQNYYGESVKKLIGVVLQRVARAVDTVFVTREHSWRVEQRFKEAGFQKRAPPVSLDLCQ